LAHIKLTTLTIGIPTKYNVFTKRLSIRSIFHQNHYTRFQKGN